MVFCIFESYFSLKIWIIQKKIVPLHSNLKTMEKDRTIIHLEWKENREPRHEFFGSPASLFDKYTASDLGIGRGALNNLYSRQSNDGVERVYNNDKCVIRKSRLYCKATTRGQKPANSTEA